MLFAIGLQCFLLHKFHTILFLSREWIESVVRESIIRLRIASGSD